MQVKTYGEPGLSLSDRLTRSSATHLISLYQRYISPHKGFCCAHRVHHGGQSCSAYAKSMVQTHGLGAAIPLVRQRFSDCGQVARMMHSQEAVTAQQSNVDPASPQRRERSANFCVDLAGDCAFQDCFSFDTSDYGCDGCGEMDLGGCDVAGCDGCDVAGCDF